MKKLPFFLLLCWLPAIVAAQHARITVITSQDFDAGVECDRQRFKVAYRMRALCDTLSQSPIEELMMLEVGRERSLFYSYNSWVVDSVLIADLRSGASQVAMQEHMQQMTLGQFTWKVYKHFPERGTATVLDGIGTGRYRCEDREMQPAWELTADTARVLGYACRGAAARFKGRTWRVWYTDEIPVPEGPWKLAGLPGLILRAEDEAGHFSFEATGIMHADSGEPILFKGDKFEPVTRRDLNKLYERFYADPIGFVSNDPNISVSVKDKQGRPVRHPRSVPYNLIER